MRTPLAAIGIASAMLAGSLVLRAQAPQAAVSFEVASVKESITDSGNPMSMIPRIMPPVNGRFSANSASLRVLVRVAYDLQDFQIVGGPSWQLSKRFDIQAKAEDGAMRSSPEMRTLLQQLLADRFALKTHMEKREMPISALVVARADGLLGPALKHSTADCPDPQAATQKLAEDYAKNGPAALMAQMQGPPSCAMLPILPTGGAMRFGLRANGQPLSQVTALLTQALGRTIQDRTGLTGLYDFELAFDPQVMMQAVSQLGISIPSGAMPQSDSPSLLTAVQEQLGLKLVSERGQVDVLVIDSAELPTPD